MFCVVSCFVSLLWLSLYQIYLALLCIVMCPSGQGMTTDGHSSANFKLKLLQLLASSLMHFLSNFLSKGHKIINVRVNLTTIVNCHTDCILSSPQISQK